jgi:hypothetical protein
MLNYARPSSDALAPIPRWLWRVRWFVLLPIFALAVGGAAFLLFALVSMWIADHR